MRILMAIISSDTHPVYVQNRDALRAKALPEEYDRVFLEYSEKIGEPTLTGDTLFLPGKESMAGILHKTLDGLEFLLKREHYDFVIRTNLSSVWEIDKLTSWLAKNPKTGFYAGSAGYTQNIGFASGTGIVLSNDMAALLVKEKAVLYEMNSTDDVNIGKFMGSHKIKLTPFIKNDISSLAEFEKFKGGSNRFLFRLKCKGARTDEPELIRRVMEKLGQN
jgi:hypothetical protein